MKNLLIFKNPRELWNFFLKEKRNSGSGVLLIRDDEIKHSKFFDSLRDLEKVLFPVIVECSVDYDSEIILSVVILQNPEIQRKKQEVERILSVFQEYEEINRKRSE